eukprot:CAMPEP_0178990694 /NCGR_PEP_ID=MMETSP0795-20121207/5106_1 /TAXON_ID=88552 /ORGANISM="Amoebophrya sp., Strain Ameob2" /LENGTH=48 /DNA_ID= /DNA_START= /DNA_END= /DNA_ORIENTATION=
MGRALSELLRTALGEAFSFGSAAPSAGAHRGSRLHGAAPPTSTAEFAA